jgi:uncharacterized membrane protein YphA (DoxX/SURF4 family)
MKKTKIIYWIFTGVLSALMLFSGIANAMVTAESIQVFHQLGYPVYLVSFLGVAKILGVVAILFPRWPRLKEWAYAGFTFDITGALYSSICIGVPVSQWSFLLIGYILIFGSYFYYHKVQQLV